MSRDLAPALVSSYSDMVEYHVADATPVDPNAPSGFLERDIHSSIYLQYSDVQSVIHSHSPDIVPYTINHVPFKPVHPLAGFIRTCALISHLMLASQSHRKCGKRLLTTPPAQNTPNWDEEIIYNSTDPKVMLVNSLKFGASLSSYFSTPSSTDPKATPDNVLVLMRGHGFTTAGTSIEEAVVQAVYSRINAEMLTTALTTNLAAGKKHGVKYLSAQEAKQAAAGPDKLTVERPWGLYSRQVAVTPLYQNFGNGTASGL